MHIPIFEQEGFEADDILGTLSALAEKNGIVPVVVSGDRDLLQLAGETLKVRIPKTKGGRTETEDYYAADVQAKYGVTPAEFIDMKALMGDASDNIPGVPGIGEKPRRRLSCSITILKRRLPMRRKSNRKRHPKTLRRIRSRQD